MFRKRGNPAISLVFVALFLNAFGLKAQIEEHKIPQVREAAIASFDTEDYGEALSGFSSLMSQFPKDAMYRYYVGVCKSELNKDLKEAAEHLVFASSRGVPVDVYYHLGEVHRKLYDFSKAKQYYIEFDEEASRAEAKARNSKLKIRSAQEAISMTQSYNPFEVLNVTFMNLYDFDEIQQIKTKAGKLGVKPPEFFMEGEDRDDLNALMFLPAKVGRGDLVYFSALPKNGREGFELMQAKKGNTGKWTDIKPLETVNTSMNEIMPYFDPIGKDLYFASDGMEGIGGFDLYRSHFDDERKEWSTPVNLGFPVNSAFDDYLLIPGADLGMVMFFSGRQATDTSQVVYRAQLVEPKRSLNHASPDEIRQIANLNGIAAHALKEIEEAMALEASYAEAMEEEGDAEIETDGSGNENVGGGEVTANRSAGTVKDEAYQVLLTKAMRHQTIADSLTELATDARVKVRKSDDPNDRWLYQKQIMVWEKKAAEEMDSADRAFSEVSAYKPKAKSLPDGMEIDTVKEGMTVYKYKEDVGEKAKEVFSKKEDKTSYAEATEGKQDVTTSYKVVSSQSTEVQGQSEHQVAKEKVYNEFEVMGASPYHSGNMVPVDKELPKGSYYKIQLGAYSKQAAYDAFGGLSPITAERLVERNLIKYYVGEFSKYADAQAALREVRSVGFGDAFVVSWYNGSKMTTEKVIKLEK